MICNSSSRIYFLSSSIPSEYKTSDSFSNSFLVVRTIASQPWFPLPPWGKRIHHLLGAGGRGISEGQAQRLAIARALLRKAPILLLDEATSGLDMVTERQLLENLRLCGLLRTCILVTHRPESARFCSRTYEIQHRQVTEVTNGV